MDSGRYGNRSILVRSLVWNGARHLHNASTKRGYRVRCSGSAPSSCTAVGSRRRPRSRVHRLRCHDREASEKTGCSCRPVSRGRRVRRCRSTVAKRATYCGCRVFLTGVPLSSRRNRFDNLDGTRTPERSPSASFGWLIRAEQIEDRRRWSRAGNRSITISMLCRAQTRPVLAWPIAPLDRLTAPQLQSGCCCLTRTSAPM
jgi:hypothetical protein